MQCVKQEIVKDTSKSVTVKPKFYPQTVSIYYSVQKQLILILLIFFVPKFYLLIDFSLTVKAATLIFISGCGSAISSAKEGKSGFIYNLVKS